ncbi:hypothetical protein Micbo1qcDRAFT_160148 [Microdochium bolleyi]|uniref:Uncharacterized protein n=1 Tax=Microdochium bolleyi TaxID=196109 RepID=A0A136JCF3_9PEZI|nr:hypothetical protein Micbo1qcDRAFT_160148 [Microdochium bolleyi]
MAGKPAGRILQAWYQWKALRLPWRKRFLVGLDLQGNTYWEFRLRRGDPPPRITSSATADDFQAVRFRRIVQYPRSSHLSDVKIPPAWHQWLRYQRPDPPSLNEQAQDVARQGRMKVLAAQADQRWNAKPSLLDMPTAAGAGRASDAAGPVPVPAAEHQSQQQTAHPAGPADSSRRAQKITEEEASSSNPWKKASKGGPSEEWQPQAWSPTAARRR